MNADLLYAILMSVGWIFLVGWLALLVVACGLAFRSDTSIQPTMRQPGFANGSYESGKVSWKIHFRS
jgi:hypothetical protein